MDTKRIAHSAQLLLRILSPIGLVASMIVAGLSLSDWLDRRQAHDLQAEVRGYPFEVPAAMDSAFSRLRWLASRDSLNFAFGMATDRAFTSNDLALLGKVRDRTQLYLLSRFPVRTPFDLAILRSYWRVHVTNAGTNTLRGVTLALPAARIARVSRTGQPPVDTIATDLLVLGDMRPKGEVVLQVWSADAPEFTSSEYIRLTHDAGIGTVEIDKPGREFTSRGGLLAPFLLWVVSVVVLLAIAAWQWRLLPQPADTGGQPSN